MDYKEMYEQAIERVKIRFGINVAAELFPELKESEDERIKDAINYAICQSTHKDGTLINGVTRESALAWLEKQGEQKPAWSEEDEDMLEHVIYSINFESVVEGLKCRGIGYSINVAERLVGDLKNWLKSLRTQKRIEEILTLTGCQNSSNIG